jgi:phasin
MSKTPFEVPSDMRAMTEQTMEHAREAVNKYLHFVQQGMSVWPGGGTELGKKAMSYTEQNVAQTFDLARKLIQANSVEDAVRLQTEFAQAQLAALTEQAKDLAETAAKATTQAMKGPFGDKP